MMEKAVGRIEECEMLVINDFSRKSFRNLKVRLCLKQRIFVKQI